MPEEQTIEAALDDGSSLRLTVTRPDSTVRGGIVLLHRARGVTVEMLELANRMAEDGWLVITPHLYHRDVTHHDDTTGSPEAADDRQIKEQVGRLTADSVLADADAALGWLAEQDVRPDRIGVLGFGVGGSVAMIVASQRSIGAAVSVGAVGVVQPVSDTLPALVEIAPALKVPWLGIYGQEAVQHAGAELAALQEAVARADTATDMVEYGSSKHLLDSESEYIDNAWNRVLNWLDSHLR